MGDRKLTYKEKAGLHFIEQEEPALIKEMKKKLGYKEAPKLEDKVRVFALLFNENCFSLRTREVLMMPTTQKRS